MNTPRSIDLPPIYKGANVRRHAIESQDKIRRHMTCRGDKKTIRVRKIGKGYSFSLSGEAGSPKTFRCTIALDGSTKVINVAAGWITHGRTTYTVSAQNVEVPETAGDYWIYMALYRSSGSWSTEARCTVNATYPSPASNEYIRVLRKVTRAEPPEEEPPEEQTPGELTLAATVNHDGDIYIDGAFAP